MPTVLDEFVFKVRYDVDESSLSLAYRRAKVQAELMARHQRDLDRKRRLGGGAQQMWERKNRKLIAQHEQLTSQVALRNLQLRRGNTILQRTFDIRKQIEGSVRSNMALDAQKYRELSARAANIGRLRREMDVSAGRRQRANLAAARGGWKQFQVGAISGFHQLDMAASRFSGAVFRIGLLMTGVGYGAYRGVSGIINAQEEITQARIGIGALYGAMTGTPTNKAMQFSSGVIEQLRMDAAKGVGDLPDYMRTYQQLLAPAVKAGASPDAMRGLTKQGIALAFALRGQEGMNLIGYDLQQALTMGVTERTTPMINLALRTVDMTNQAFNKLDIANRVKVLTEALSNFDEVVEVMGKTWTAQQDTFRENIRQFIRVATADLFERWTQDLRDLNEWFTKNREEIEAYAKLLGEKLLRAWDKVIAVVKKVDHIVRGTFGGWEKTIKAILAAGFVLFLARIAALAASVGLPLAGALKSFSDGAVGLFKWKVAADSAKVATDAFRLAVGKLGKTLGVTASVALIPVEATVIAGILAFLATLAINLAGVITWLTAFQEIWYTIWGQNSLINEFLDWMGRGTPAMQELSIALRSLFLAMQPWVALVGDMLAEQWDSFLISLSDWVHYFSLLLYLVTALVAEFSKFIGLTESIGDYAGFAGGRGQFVRSQQNRMSKGGVTSNPGSLVGALMSMTPQGAALTGQEYGAGVKYLQTIITVNANSEQEMVDQIVNGVERVTSQAADMQVRALADGG